MSAGTKIPPMPATPPDVHLRSKGKSPRTLKGDLRSLKERVSTARDEWKSGQERSEKRQEEVRTQAQEILAPVQGKIDEEKKLVSEVAEPVKKIIESSREALGTKSGRTRPYVTSFMISCIASWAVGPQILTSLYGWARFGVFPEDWGLLQGPGRWFRDTLRMAHETNQNGALIWSIVLGLLPMTIMFIRNVAAGYLAQSTYQGRFGMFGIKWLTRLSYLIVILFLVGIPYPDQVQWLFGSSWVLEWWNFWVAGLFCSAFYCTLWVFDRFEKRLPLGATHVVLMMPLASIISGFCLNAPDAAW